MLEFDPDFYDRKSDVQFKLGLKTINVLNVKNGEAEIIGSVSGNEYITANYGGEKLLLR